MTGRFEQPQPPQEKEETLSAIYKELERLRVDPGIQETVAYLNMLGFETSESCEGHADRANPAPRVNFSAPSRPRWRYVGEKESYETAAKKHGLTLDEVLEFIRPKYGEDVTHPDPENEERLFQASQEGDAMTPRLEEHEDFKKWWKETEALSKKMIEWLEEFYREREVADDIRLKLHRDEDTSSYFLHNGGTDFLSMADSDVLQKLAPAILAGRKLKNEAYQNEMRAFTAFLRQKYDEVK